MKARLGVQELRPSWSGLSPRPNPVSRLFPWLPHHRRPANPRGTRPVEAVGVPARHSPAPPFSTHVSRLLPRPGGCSRGRLSLQRPAHLSLPACAGGVGPRHPRGGLTEREPWELQRLHVPGQTPSPEPAANIWPWVFWPQSRCQQVVTTTEPVQAARGWRSLSENNRQQQTLQFQSPKFSSRLPANPPPQSRTAAGRCEISLMWTGWCGAKGSCSEASPGNSQGKTDLPTH